MGKKLSMAQAQAEARKAPKYVLHSDQFGFDMFISSDGVVTDTVEGAMQFSVGYDSEEMKLGMWKAITGYDLKAKRI